ncbi:MAG: acyltransferase family protein [Nitrosomonas halophila]
MSGSESKSLSYRPDVDGLRAVAVISVVFYHVGFAGFSGGFVGVDIFFVISGYLIARLLRDELAAGHFSIVGFYERRARRILPALMAMVFASLVVGGIFLGPKAYLELAESALATAFFGSNFYFWKDSGDYFADSLVLEPLLHTWSLAVEEQFYLLFPLMLWGMRGVAAHARSGIFALICLVSFVSALLVVDQAPTAAFYLLPARAWELGIGVMLALHPVTISVRRWHREALALVGLAAILVTVLVYDDTITFPGLSALLPCLGAAALIRAGEYGPTIIGSWLSLRPMVFMGLISYSLYLWHWPVLALLRSISGTIELALPVASGVVLTSFVFAVLSWRLVEQPFRRRPPYGPDRCRVFFASLAGLAAVMALSGTVLQTDGLPERLPESVRLAYPDAEDRNPYRKPCFKRLPEEGLCYFGAHGTPDVVYDLRNKTGDFLLWGDSHALAALPAIGVAARELGQSGFFAGESGCPPLLGVDRVDDEPGMYCADFNAAVIKMLEQREDLGTVILLARWALATEGHGVPGELAEPAILDDDDINTETPTDPSGNYALFRSGLEATVAAILATGRRVVLIGGVPEIGWHVPDALARHRRFGSAMPQPPEIDAVLQRNQRAHRVMHRLARLEGVSYILPAPWLCNPACPVEERGRPLYYDDEHLTKNGALSLLLPIMRDALH